MSDTTTRAARTTRTGRNDAARVADTERAALAGNGDAPNVFRTAAAYGDAMTPDTLAAVNADHALVVAHYVAGTVTLGAARDYAAGRMAVSLDTDDYADAKAWRAVGAALDTARRSRPSSGPDADAYAMAVAVRIVALRRAADALASGALVPLDIVALDKRASGDDDARPTSADVASALAALDMSTVATDAVDDAYGPTMAHARRNVMGSAHGIVNRHMATVAERITSGVALSNGTVYALGESVPWAVIARERSDAYPDTIGRGGSGRISARFTRDDSTPCPGWVYVPGTNGTPDGCAYVASDRDA